MDDQANDTTVREADSAASHGSDRTPRTRGRVRTRVQDAADRGTGPFRGGEAGDATTGEPGAAARSRPTRRFLLRAGAAAGLATAALPSAEVHGQAAGGRLSVGLWDHWVPAANTAMRRLVEEWARKEHVDVQLDFITTNGNKVVLTAAAEAQARQGHDILPFALWMVHNHQALLDPLDDVMGRLTAAYGPPSAASEYLGKINGRWRAVPTASGSQYKGSAARMDLMLRHAGIDVRAMYPAETRLGPGAEQWDWETFLGAAEACNKAGFPFVLPAGTTSDTIDWIGALFRCHGADMTDAQGHPALRGNERVRHVLDYAARLFRHIPAEMFAADDATNNRALIAAKSALIFNPPSAWAVATRDAPQVAEQLWHFPSPAGPAGRFVPHLPFFWGVWNFARNKPAAKALVEHLSRREQVAALVEATSGYDIPPFASMTDLDTWSTVGPPRGTVFNYPVRPHHGAEPCIAAAPSPPDVAVRIYAEALQPRMIARVVQGREPLDRVLAWAEREIEGYRRG